MGYKADVIKDYFLRYNEALSNDFILSGDGNLELLSTDIQDWRIAFVNTGVNAADRPAAEGRPEPHRRPTRCSWPTTATT